MSSAKAMGIAIAMLSASVVSGASNAVRLTVNSNSRIWIEGNSSFMPYESRTSVFSVAVGGSNTGKHEAYSTVIQESQITDAVLVIPVTNLRSETIGLDPFLYETLNARDHPDIMFRIMKYSLEPDAKRSNRYTIRVSGVITIAGREKQIELEASADVSNGIRVSGGKDLLMSDFGITPPSIFFGMIVCDDKITVKWDLSVSSDPVAGEIVSDSRSGIRFRRELSAGLARNP